ncbi:hypothetical protein CDD80_4723 [Ophiocordyceps camponoti-rufipedis]|uniref:Uncharacterized protein n=1 Tax=Ophiocordyceps camponoti-rufipedis TaxID=2004952 RepID=A0A2C5YRL4_9HYPO|nr:hypothetical protein CDD80_4723 [Ophiocordyceps camponoti-rufipedis]
MLSHIDLDPPTPITGAPYDLNRYRWGRAFTQGLSRAGESAQQRSRRRRAHRPRPLLPMPSPVLAAYEEEFFGQSSVLVFPL